MAFDISNIRFSSFDKQKKVILPNKLTPNLAEFIGIVVGDGHIDYRKNKHYEITIVGDKKLDYEFHTKRINRLTKKLFNVKAITKKSKHANAIVTRFSSKAVVNFLILCCGMKSGDKIKNKKIIPKLIINGKPKIIKPFLRGLADTDFSIRFKKRKDVKKLKNKHHHPIIEGHFGSSKPFIIELHKLIKKAGFNNHIEYPHRYLKYYNKTYQNFKVNIVGKKNLIRWMKEIGFSNKRQNIKYLIWKKEGYCEPYSTV